jgi:hypothetical protein
VLPVVLWRQQWRVPAGQEARLTCAHAGQAEVLTLPLPPSSIGWQCHQDAGKSTQDDGDWMWMPAVCRRLDDEAVKAEAQAAEASRMPDGPQRLALLAQNSRMALPMPSPAAGGKPVDKAGLRCPASLVMTGVGRLDGQGQGLAQALGQPRGQTTGHRVVALSGMNVIEWRQAEPGANGGAGAEQVEVLLPDQIEGEDGPLPRRSRLVWQLEPAQGVLWMHCEYQGAGMSLLRPVMAKGALVDGAPGSSWRAGVTPEVVSQCQVRTGVSRVAVPRGGSQAQRAATHGVALPWAPSSRVLRQVLEARCGS